MPARYACGMTIDEQLGFSVLTAPLATVDRRALSQAWFSALYGERVTHEGETPQRYARPEARPAAERPLCARRAAPVKREPSREATGVRIARAARAEAEIAPAERRAMRSPLARKIERTFLRPPAPPHYAAFALGGALGRVQVLLRSGGQRVRLVAICPRQARAQVAAALAQARYALALRGIDIDARTAEDAGSC